MSSTTDEKIEQKKQWEGRISALHGGLAKLEDLERQLSWVELDTLKTLKRDLKALGSFYNFLVLTQFPISSPELGYFCVLPTEVVLYIFSYLDHKGLCGIAQVCREFKVLADDERIWQQYWLRVYPTLGLPSDYPVDKPGHKTWKWLCQSKLKIFKDTEVKNGVGTFIYPSKPEVAGGVKFENKYSGDWKNDQRHGFGTFYWCGGSWYIGDWVDDKREGNGTRAWPNGNKYVGGYKNHKRHGEGEFTFSNGSIFKGQFEDNKFIHGTYTWPNGRIYDGEWNNIYRHGKGLYKWPDGRQYYGQWKSDKRHGHGIYRWPDGDEYEGEFVEGKRWGKGILRRENGETYDQEWKEAKFEEYNKGLDLDNYGSETEAQTSKPVSNKKRKMEDLDDSPGLDEPMHKSKHHKHKE